MEEQKKYPTETVDLPSKGKFYPPNSPLSSGTVEMKYMTAKEEDILTNTNYIDKGITVDKLIQSLLVDKKIDYNQLLEGDKDALLIAARILGYGKDYEFNYRGEIHNVDLTTIENKPLHEEVEKATENAFTWTAPSTEDTITFKLLTHEDEQKIISEVNGLKKIYKDSSPELSTRLKHTILSVNGDSERKNVRSFVDNQFLARDAREFRKYIKEIEPGVNLTFYPDNSPEGGVDIPIGVSFLWPDAAV